MKKIYRFLNNHIQGLVWFMMLLLIPCAFSRHVATWTMVFAYLLWFILHTGNMSGWDKEE